MAVSSTDLQRIADWCEQRTPEHVRDQIWIEHDVTPRHVDIMECRPDWMDPQNRPAMRFPIARLRYTTRTGLWTIYWRDRNLTFHHYPDFQPTSNVREALAFLDTTDDPIFWG
ncbi:DUF3024 domain-containing protein [Nesterenkonia sp. PF2B19]|uniref:DUF3024 domain-containing protein n=1 Tax=Nesterenkonia sp. PF2B19 TaxID=1881858 RepID=UPI0008727848|nr:DUF3024 domain-containing protein [Nesterenkonia sp. PF2B19]OSM44624.1 hypothetical protein BCY76_001670 [Nesterenkonia sp. PF2B19]